MVAVEQGGDIPPGYEIDVQHGQMEDLWYWGIAVPGQPGEGSNVQVRPSTRENAVAACWSHLVEVLESLHEAYPQATIEGLLADVRLRMADRALRSM